MVAYNKSCSILIVYFINYYCSMIFEQSINHAEAKVKPTIKFNYISPSNLPRVYSVANYRPAQIQRYEIFTRTQPYYQFPKKNMESVGNLRKSQRKKIFDRTYTANSANLGRKWREQSLDFQRQKKRSSTHKNNQSVKKARKAIFSRPARVPTTASKDEDGHFKASTQFYPSSQASDIKFQRPQSLTSYINIDALRRQARHSHDRFASSNETDRLFIEMATPYDCADNASSQVKVDVSESSDTNKSINCSNIPADQNEERFFDKDLGSPLPEKRQKLSEVALYSTTINGNFGRQAATQLPNFISRIKRFMPTQMSSNLLPLLLVVMGLFLLVLQAWK